MTDKGENMTEYVYGPCDGFPTVAEKVYPNKEMVNHPDHYQSYKGLEVIDVIEAFTENLTGVEAFDTGNIIKYICRWKKKSKPVEDLKKVVWYTQHLINHLENTERTDEKD